jgi:hypothetical protein
LSAQKNSTALIEYVSPLPNSSSVSPLNNITIRCSESIDKTSLGNNAIIVNGTVSGHLDGKLIISDDDKAIIFKPYNPFEEGESIKVELSNSLKTVSGKKVEKLIFSFKVSDSWNEYLSYNPNKPLLDNYVISSKRSQVNDRHSRIETSTVKMLDSLPSDFPDMIVTVSNDPTDGFIFLSPYPWPNITHSYLIIMDNKCIPIFYRKFPNLCFDFKINSNGLLTFFDGSNLKFYALDSSYCVVDSFYCGNGYRTDPHD